MSTIETQSAESAHKRPKRQQWSGQWGFIISAIGSAVGLGNIWRFPGVAYENGGGAFMIPYLVALLTAGIPILFLDYSIGHRWRGSAPLAFRRIKRWLESLGWFQVIICCFIFLYYAAILAWAASYFVFSFTLAWGDDAGAFLTQSYLQLPALTADDGSALPFNFAPAWGVFVPLLLIWIAAIAVMALNLSKGLEKANIFFMPMLCVTFGILVVGALFLPGAVDGLNALFTPDFSAIMEPNVWIAAYSQIFFSLSIAFGIMLTYSSYRRRRANLTSPGLVVGFANSSFELLAGLGVFSVLGFMANQAGTTVDKLDNLTGPMLSFVTFPTAISQMPFGPFFGAMFFLSLLLAGFTSMLSIFEVVSAGFTDKFGWSRVRAALTIGIPAAAISIGLFGSVSGLYNLDIVDNFTNNIGVVTSAVLTIVTVIWIARKGNELAYHLSSISTFKVGFTWKLLVGVISPLMLGYMLVITVKDLIEKPYGGYPEFYVATFGWGAVAVMVIGALGLTYLTKWKFNPEGFTPWPAFPPVSTETTKGGVR
ncbi:MAG: sodium-dependent transporter [Propionibacteriaceae bacterium]|jgi:NSS family neurotransmitter:Na+ symporter|nr:sodium-dependent transporter [Propionibacteriaceae bacterium]